MMEDKAIMKKKSKKEKQAFIRPIYDAIDFQKIKELWNQARGKKAKFEIAFLYLTGARVGEAIQVRKADFKYLKKDGKEYLTVTLPTLKNRRRKTRIIPIVKKEPYLEMIGSIEDYLNFLYPTERVISVKTTRGLEKHIAGIGEFETMAIFPKLREKKIVKKRLFPHYLRHCRATHLVQYHRTDGNKLMFWMGWSDPRLSAIYVHLDWQSLAEMIENGQVPTEW